MSQKNHFDPSINVLTRQNKNLDAFFKPKTVALIGATEKENSVGKTILWNLLRSPFGGTVYPVNPKRANVLGIKAYPTVGEIEEDIDLAVIVTPAKFVPGLIEECTQKNVKAVVIISAGFKEIGEEGEELERQVLKNAKKGKMRIIGPNCLGVMNPMSGLNATFAEDIGLKGNIAFISQSGALCTAVLDWSFEANIGFSSFVSIGSMADVGWGDLIRYFGHDHNTKSILIYMESVGDPRSFLSAAREVALTKPIILIKAGRTEESAKAATSHTGALSGSDDVFDAALRRVGVLRVDSISDLFSMAEVFSKQPPPKGPRLSIITNAGGPAVIATDALIESGGKLAELSKESAKNLDSFLPPSWSHNNPVDILGDASPELYAKTIEILQKDENNDGLLVILTPQDMTDPTKTAELMTSFAKSKKPLLASWMGARTIKKGADILNQMNIPTFPFPDLACKAFSYMYKYNYNLEGIYETPTALEDFSLEKDALRKQKVLEIFQKAREEKRTLLDEHESKKILEIYGIPTVRTEVALTKKEAVTYAKEIGFPIVLKLFSKTITHKTDVGGVILNLKDEKSIERAFDDIYSSVSKIKGKEHFGGVTVQPMVMLKGHEVILGSSIDPEFGPVLLFGMGGQWVEILKDRSLGLPPLNSTLAKRMIKQTKIYTALQGARGQKGCDVDQLIKILVRFSHLIVEHREIAEFDINPLLASEKTLIALDARIVLSEENEKTPPLAIRPYPTEYSVSTSLKDGTQVTIRPIRPEDEIDVEKFHKELSERTVRQRFLKAVHYDQRIVHQRLVRICFNDYDQEIALIVQDPKSNEIFGICRLTKIEDGKKGNFSMMIIDKMHRRGIGKILMEMIIKIAKQEGICHIVAEMLNENIEMQGLLKKFQFSLEKINEDRLLADLDLTNG